jgi:hypothetical protein
MWNMTGVPLRIVMLVAGIVLLLSQLGNIRFWRFVDDATTPGKEHAGLTRQEAVSGAVARVEGFLDAHDYPRGRIQVVRAEPISGRVQFWCKGCEHWQVELTLRDDRYCIAISEEFAALALADQSKGFTCDLVGTTALAKSYGLFRVYSLERSSA